jgi:RHS repeat-associated protein
MSYNSVGGITSKIQNHTKAGQEQKKTTYNLAYVYGSEQPHAPKQIGDNTYTYDANGNQTGWKDNKTAQERKLMWDEENRIRSIADNGAFYHYAYDAAGERVWKGKSTGQRIFVNGEWVAGNGSLGNYIVYVNPYLVLKSGGYTKHYYIEGQRIVSKLGGGFENNTPTRAGNGKVDYDNIHRKVFDGIVKNLKFLGADGQILTAGKSGKIPPGQVSGTGNISEASRYFYHPDHLGSTSYVTDVTGEVYQHLEYFAFGETFVEEHSNTDRTPYLFNGKELDEETGLYYYGARYYDPRTSVWQSVDPEAELYNAQSPYCYSLNNPINLNDPNGKNPEWPVPNTIPIALSRIKSLGVSKGNFGAMNVYYNYLPRSSPRELYERNQRIKNAEDMNNLLGEAIEHPLMVIINEAANIKISNEKHEILNEASKIENAFKEKQQFNDRAKEANILMDNIDIANRSDVFGEKLDENTILDLTNYSMISKYGDSEKLSNPLYKGLFKGGNSKEYLEKLKGLSNKFKDEFKSVNLNKLDGPPNMDNSRARKYKFKGGDE